MASGPHARDVQRVGQRRNLIGPQFEPKRCEPGALRIDPGRVEIGLSNKDYRLDIKVTRDSATALASPIRGFMDGRIEESMTSAVEVVLVEARTGRELFRDVGRNAAAEVAGDLASLPRV